MSGYPNKPKVKPELRSPAEEQGSSNSKNVVLKKTRSAVERQKLRSRIEKKEKGTAPNALSCEDILLMRGHPERFPPAKEKLREAHKAVQVIISNLNAKPAKPVNPSFAKGKAILKALLSNPNFDRFLPLMIKESALDLKAASKSGAVGYFQIKEKSCAPELKQYFDFDIDTSPLDASVKNCVAGVLYFALIKNNTVSSNPQYKHLSEDDKTQITRLMYNAGPARVSALWATLKPKNFVEFEKALYGHLQKAIGSTLTKPAKTVDSDYFVEYMQLPGADNYLKLLALNSKTLDNKIKIGESEITIRKLGEMLRYTQIIKSISALKVDSEPKNYILGSKNTTARIGFWTTMDNFRIRLTAMNYKGISEGESPAKRAGDRVFLTDAIFALNKRFNPAFKTIASAGNVPVKTVINLPNITYLEMYRTSCKRPARTVSVATKTPEKLGKTSEYMDPSLEATGNQKLTNKYKLDLKKLGTYPGMKLYSGKRKREKTTHIILHSTSVSSPREGGPADRGVAGTARDHGAHYVIARDGTIHAIRDRNDRMNHAGRGIDRPAGASWNGNEEISNHSIGIEVATFKGEKWTAQQYEATKKLVHALGAVYQIPRKNVLAHHQIACSKWGRGRKSDPIGLDWAKLDLPNNYRLIDKDAATGRIEPNFSSLQEDWKANGVTSADRETMIQGLRYGVKLRNDATAGKK